MSDPRPHVPVKVASHAPSANTAAVVTLPAVAGSRTRIEQITWSYSNSPTNGGVTITGLEGDDYQFGITAGGPGFVPTAGVRSESNTAAVITLAAGGSGISGKINVHYWVE